jgi:GTP cyclohydrolase II
LTNNPEKLDALQQQQIEIVERIPLKSKANRENEKYLEAKKKWMGHLFDS